MSDGDDNPRMTQSTHPADAPDGVRDAIARDDCLTSNQQPATSNCVRDAIAQHERPLLLYAWRLIGNAERAREIVQESFAKLVVEQNKGGLNGSLTPWLYAVCRNQALDVRRKERRMKLMIDPEQQAGDIASSSDPADEVEQTDTTSRVINLLAHLPAKQREVIRLKFQGGLSYRQISDVTGLSESNVGFLIHTGLKTLRERMTE